MCASAYPDTNQVEIMDDGQPLGKDPCQKKKNSDALTLTPAVANRLLASYNIPRSPILIRKASGLDRTQFKALKKYYSSGFLLLHLSLILTYSKPCSNATWNSTCRIPQRKTSILKRQQKTSDMASPGVGTLLCRASSTSRGVI